jgi:hypothetical protein
MASDAVSPGHFVFFKGRFVLCFKNMTEVFLFCMNCSISLIKK